MGNLLKYIATGVLATSIYLTGMPIKEAQTSKLETKVMSIPIQMFNERDLFPLIEKSQDKLEELENTPKNMNYLVNELDILHLGKMLYAEAADQPEKGRELIARVILNRVDSPLYPNSIENVIHEKHTRIINGITYDTYAFSAVNDNVNINWKQATGELPMNNYEKNVFEDTKEDARDMLTGKVLGIPRENEIIAYHDWSINKPNTSYWNGLEEVHQEGKLIFYAPKIKSNKKN